jgi:protein-S-isoprenylcysteine O-methyltransferase Ste14
VSATRFFGVVLFLLGVSQLLFPETLMSYGLTLQYVRIIGMGILFVGLLLVAKTPRQRWKKVSDKNIFD